MRRPEAEYLYPVNGRRELLPLLPSSLDSLLDVGCGSGGFGATVRDVYGEECVAWGVEPNEVAAEKAAGQYSRVLRGIFPDALANEDVCFDCIAFNDVLEHMVDPWTTLRESRRYLKRDGIVIASIPNIRFLYTLFDLVVLGKWTYVERGVLDRTHLRFFTRRTIIELFEGCGFEIDVMYGVNPIGHARAAWAGRASRVLGEFSYSGFALRARVRDEADA